MDDLKNRVAAAVRERYEVLAVVGQGGMATVLSAHDRKNDRIVALKVINEDLSPSVDAERFRREIRIVGALNHPNILPLFDSGQAEGFSYYVMPLFESDTLADRLARRGRVSLDEALKVLQQVGAALDYAHERMVVHRDIKPSNILLTNGWEAVLADFGIARLLGRPTERTLTRQGSALGSAPYMSPEQAGGAREPDSRADVYSLGCVLFEMLTGQTPYNSNAPFLNILAQHARAEIPSCRAIRPDIPEAVDQAIRTALAKDPDDRFASVTDFVDAATASVEPTPPPTPGKTWSRFTRLGAALTAVLAIGYVVDQGWFRGQESEPNTLAVWPFENIGQPGDEAFADGITVSVTTNLHRIESLRIIGSRTSERLAAAGLGGGRTLSDLRPTYILTGTIRWYGGTTGRNRVRVNPSLIRVQDGEEIWAAEFDGQLDEIANLEIEIATGIALALGSRFRQETSGTSNPEAWDQYLRGLFYYESSLGGSSRLDLTRSVDHLRRATQLDDEFVEAYWALTKAYSFALFNWPDLGYTRQDAEQALAEARELAPERAGTTIASAIFHYHGVRDYDRAYDDFTEALLSEPNNNELTRGFGLMLRRMGRWDAAIARLLTVAEVDPEDRFLMQAIGRTYLLMKQYDEAERYLDRAIALDTRAPASYLRKLDVLLMRGAPWEDVRSTIDDASTRLAPAWLIDGEDPGAVLRLSMLVDSVPELFAVNEVLRTQSTPFDTHYQTLASAVYHRRAGDTESAVSSLRAAAESLERLATEAPTNFVPTMLLGLVHAELGERPEALAALERSMATVPIERDVMSTGPLEARARALATLGDREEAIAALIDLSPRPALISAAVLARDPVWRSIRDDTRFVQLLEPDSP